MTTSVMSSVAPTFTASVISSEAQNGSGYHLARISAPRVVLFCKSQRAAGKSSCFPRSQTRPKSQQSTCADQRRHVFGVPWASYGEAEAASETLSASTKGSGKAVEDVKKAVMRAVSGTNRGKNTTYEQRQGILRLLKELEALNPTANPVNSPLFSGRWALLYTAPVDEETADKYAGTEEGPFLARVKPAALGSVRQTRSVQVIDSAAGIAENIAYFIAFGAEGNLNIRGSVTPALPEAEAAVRVNVTFESFVLTIGGWKSPTISLSWIKPQGWVDTTFLDGDMRIGRGDKGSIFVSSHMKQDKN